MDASTPEEMPITSQSTAAPSASDAVTGTRCQSSVVTGVEL